MKKQFSILKTNLGLLLVLLGLILSTGNAEAQYINSLSDSWSKAPTAAYSTRKVMSTYTGPAMRLRRSNDNAETDVFFDTNGWVSMTSNTGTSGSGVSLATWVGSNSAYVTRWYDQSGNGYHATEYKMYGKLTCSGTAVIGSGSKFNTDMAVGNTLCAADGTLIGTISSITNATTLTLTTAGPTITTATQFYTRETQPLFISAGVIQTMSNGRPALKLQNGSNQYISNGFTTTMGISDANVNVFAVLQRTNAANANGFVLGNNAMYNAASTNYISVGYSDATNLGIRATTLSTLATTLNSEEAVNFYLNAKKTTTENAGIKRLDALGSTTTTNKDGAITFTSAKKIELFRAANDYTYSTRSFTGYCPEIIYYTNATNDVVFNSDDATDLLASQRYGLINYAPTVLESTNATATSLTYNWSNDDPNLGTIGTDYSYRLQYSTSSDFTSPTEVVVNSGSSPFSYNFSGLTAGNTYYFRIRLEKTGFNGIWSDPLLFGTIKVGASQTYTNIQTAYDLGIPSTIYNPATIELQSDYNPALETYPITFTAKTGASATNTITIKPKSGVNKVIGPTNQTKTVTASISSATTDLVLDDVTGLSTSSYVGGNYVYTSGTFKQLSAVNAGTKTVTFAASTFTNATAVTTTFFIGPAQTQAINFNGAQYVIIDGVSRTDALTGLTIQNPNAIYAQTLNFTGNANNNIVQNCIVRGANQTSAWGSGFQGTVYFNGSNTNTITNNDVCDMGNGSPYPVCAFQMTGAGTNYSNTISSNNVYNISNIYASTQANSGFFQFGSTSTTTSHSNAVLDNKLYLTGTAYFRSGANVVGIGVGSNMNGLNNRLEGNTIGYANTEGTGTATIDMTGTSGTFKAIANLKNFTCKNNTIGNISMSGGTVFTGIEFTTSNTSSPNANDVCYGNQVKNISMEVTAGATMNGILWSVANPYSSNISNNTVNDLTLTSSSASITCRINGIYSQGTATGNTFNYTGNNVYNLTAGNSSSTVTNEIYGLYTLGGTSTVERNLVYNLNAISTGSPIIKGIGGATGNGPQYTIKNNIISLGSDVTSNAIIYGLEYSLGTAANQTMNVFNYHNSIYINGTATKSGGPTNATFAMFLGGNTVPTNHSIKNNIFANQRENSEIGTAKHYAFRFAYTTNVSIKYMNNNLYWASPLGLYSTTKDYANLAAWKQSGGNTEIQITNDENSTEGNPQFLSASDLRVQTYSTAVAAKGATGTGVTDDYTGVGNRAATPAIGAYEFTYASTASDNYRSLATGNWGTAATWQASPDNTNWANATLAPSATAASVTIQNAHTIDVDANITTPNLTLNSGSILNVNAGKQLTVSTTLNNSGTLNLLSSSEDGTATILTPATLGGTGGTYNTNQYLTTGRNWYVSSPSSATALPTVASGTITLNGYSEADVIDVAGATGWVLSPSTFETGKGYTASVSTNGNITFTGALNTGNKNIALTSRIGTANKAGFNLVGNPYPSYLDWTAVTDDVDNAAKLRSTTLWYRTKVLNAQSELVYSFWTINGDGVGVPNGASVKIPPMQSFWVRAVEGVSSPIVVTNTMRSHAPVTDKMLKAPSAKNADRTLVRLQVSNGVNTDEAVVYFSAKAKNGLDALDAPKMTNGNAAIPEIYTTLQNERFVINSMNTIPLDSPIGVGFIAGSAESFSIKANEITNLPEGVKLMLKDNVTLAETDLSENVIGYQFTPQVTSADRFSLIFRTAGSTTDMRNANSLNAQVFVNGANQITIVAPEKSNYAIYNAMGQMIENGQTTAKLQTVNSKLNTGVYVVKVGNESTRVIVK